MSRLLGFGKSGGSGKGSAQSNNPATIPQERKRDRLLPFLWAHSRSPSPNPSSSALQLAADPSKDSDLWTQAYHKLPNKLKQHLGANLERLEPTEKLQALQKVLQTAIQAKEANMAHQLKLKWGDKEINVQESADRLVGWITKFKEVGDIAVQHDPVHAALPWAGVRFILLVRCPISTLCLPVQ